MYRRKTLHAPLPRAACLAACLAAGLGAQNPEVLYEHRAVVATTSLDRELDVDQSLERNVNLYAAQGFEVGAISGGHGALLDKLLERKPYVAGQVDHSGHVFVIMHRPVGRRAPAREYRFLHTRTSLGVEPIVARLGEQGFRLAATAREGEIFHGAFERIPEAERVSYRVFRSERRRGWDYHMLNDPDVRQRLRRVIQITLDGAIAELGPPAATPAEFVWESGPLYNRYRTEERLQALAAAGFRVQSAWIRNNTLDVALLKPAGAAGPAPALDVDDGPWGGPCSRGRIAGADIWTDGDVYCVAEDPKGPVMNRGFDLEVAPEAEMDGRLFFGRLSCLARASMLSRRPAALRVALAGQLEREINRQTPRGYRVTRAFAGVRADGGQRLVIMASLLPPPEESGPGPGWGEPPRLMAEPDGLGQQLLAQRERELNRRLADELRDTGAEVWAELHEEGRRDEALLLGCAETRLDRERAETVLRRLLPGTPRPGPRIQNRIRVEGFR